MPDGIDAIQSVSEERSFNEAVEQLNGSRETAAPFATDEVRRAQEQARLEAVRQQEAAERQLTERRLEEEFRQRQVASESLASSPLVGQTYSALGAINPAFSRAGGYVAAQA